MDAPNLPPRVRPPEGVKRARERPFVLLRENPRFAKNQATVMDIEHINQIGNNLADLTARTDALRGYL